MTLFIGVRFENIHRIFISKCRVDLPLVFKLLCPIFRLWDLLNNRSQNDLLIMVLYFYLCIAKFHFVIFVRVKSNPFQLFRLYWKLNIQVKVVQFFPWFFFLLLQKFFDVGVCYLYSSYQFSVDSEDIKEIIV